MVNRRVRILAAIAGAVVAAVVVVTAIVLAASPGAPTPALPRSGLLIRSTVMPANAFFGDTLAVRVDLLFNPHRLATPTLSVTRRFSSYQVHGTPAAERGSVGTARSLSYVLRLTCLETSCLPGNPTRDPHQSFLLPSVRVDYRRRTGGKRSMQVPLPSIDVGSRLTPEEGATLLSPPHPPLAASLRPLGVHYPLSPTLLIALLLAGSIALFATAGTLVWLHAPRWRRSRPVSRLERALELLEWARADGAVPEQRKALELLAHELGRTGDEHLALSARVLAWSPPPPEKEATWALAGEVRNTIDRRTNGRAH